MSLFVICLSCQNCSYIQNPGFPAGSTATTALTYTVSKVSSGVNKHRTFFQVDLTFCSCDCRCLHSLPGLWDIQPCWHKRQQQWQWRRLHWHLCSDGNSFQFLNLAIKINHWTFPRKRALTHNMFLQTSSSGKTTPTICGLNTGQHSNKELFVAKV